MELEGLRVSRKLIKIIFNEILKGKSIYRTLMNYALSEFELSGEILDLGSGSDSASYNRFLKYKDPFRVTYSDYYKNGKNLIKINLEEPFEIERNRFEYVMCFNTLEHIYNFKNVAKESYRILKNGGVFIGSTPFVSRFHPDPYDYFRYSHEALIRIFEEENYICHKIIILGFGPFLLTISHWEYLLPKMLRPVFILSNILLDMVLNKLSESSQTRHPLGYVFVFTKP